MAKRTQPMIGIDLGGTNIQAAVVDSTHRVLARAKLKTKAGEGNNAVTQRIAQVVEEAARDAGLTLKKIGGVGIGAPGASDIEHGIVLNAPNLRWTRYPLGRILEKRLGRPVVVDNDVNVAAWGEFVAGAGQGQTDLLAIWIGTGIGGGLILNGQLYHGHFQTAGEVGHLILDIGAPLGRRTTENNASRTAIVHQIVQLVQSNHASRILAMADNDPSQIRSKVLARAVQEGDELTLTVVRQAAQFVGAAIANTVTTLSLGCVVIGGGLTDSLGKTWIAMVRQAFDQSVFPAELKHCRLVASRLGEDAGTIGAAMLAQDRLLKKRS